MDDMVAAGTIRVGLDVVDADAVLASINRHGDRYTQRLFTPTELDESAGEGTVRARSLAARFAAKEAVIKILTDPERTPLWREIEVYRRPGGGCGLRLSGTAADCASDVGLDAWSVCLTHEGRLSAAVVLAAVA